jgi:hypothetical protein
MTVGSSTTPSTTTNLIQFNDDFAAVFKQENEDLIVSTQGAIDKTRVDAMIEMSGTPVAYTPSQSTVLNLIFAQFGQLPLIGASLCGSSDVPVIYLANNSTDALAVYNVCCPKPPNLTLHIKKPIIDKLTLVGLIRNGYDRATANSYYKYPVTGLTYAPPVLLQSGDLIGKQRYYGNWSAGNSACSNTDWTNFEGQDGVTISFEADWQPVKKQGVTVDYTLGPKGLRAMAKCVPVGPLAADIQTVLQFQGVNLGSQLSANTAMGDCIFTGQVGGSFNIKNAVLETAGFVFAGVPLRLGEIGFVGTFNLTASPSTGGIYIS